MIYDAIMRLPFSIWVLTCAMAQAAELIQYASSTHGFDAGHAIHMAMRISLIGFLLLLGTVSLLRTRPSTKAPGLEPRLSALAGTFLIYGVVFFPRHQLSMSAEVVSTLLTSLGSTAAMIALSQLGRSFSLMAESRRLVMTGVYGWVRHPLYLAEEIAMIGVFMQFASVWTGLIFAAQIAFQFRRMHNEEVVLAATFPEYASYQRHTARLIAGIY